MNSTLARVLLLGLAVVGCSSTGVGNPGVANLALTSDPEVEPSAIDDLEQLPPENLRRALLVFGKLTFLACDARERDESVTGPFVIDLASNQSEPPIPAVSVPEGGFCGIDATLAPATQPAALAGRSMFFSGLRNDGTLFLLFANMPGTLRMRPIDHVDWSMEPKHEWLWALRPKRWVLPSELEGLQSEPLDAVSQVIPIDVNRHPVLYSSIRERIASRSTLHLDVNDNHRLDDDERRGAPLIGQGLDSLD